MRLNLRQLVSHSVLMVGDNPTKLKERTTYHSISTSYPSVFTLQNASISFLISTTLTALRFIILAACLATGMVLIETFDGGVELKGKQQANMVYSKYKTLISLKLLI